MTRNASAGKHASRSRSEWASANANAVTAAVVQVHGTRWRDIPRELRLFQAKVLEILVDYQFRSVAFLVSTPLYGRSSFTPIVAACIYEAPYEVDLYMEIYVLEDIRFMIIFYNFFSCGAAAQRGPWPPHVWGFLITHNDASQSVRLLWTSH